MGTSNKTLVVGTTVTESTQCSGTTYAKNYSIILSVLLNSVDEDSKKGNVTLKATLKSNQYTSWASDTCKFDVLVNDEVVKTASASSGGSSSSNTSSKTFVTWTGDVPYNEDGTLELKLQAKVSGGSTTYSPGSGVATINATFPLIDVSNVHIGMDGTIKTAKAYVGINGIPVEVDVYVGLDGTPKKCA